MKSILKTVCFAGLWLCSMTAVPMDITNSWNSGGYKVAQVYCTFTITEFKAAGAWTMTVNANIPTEYITIWIMTETSRLNDGRTYELQSKYDTWPSTIDVSFHLTYVEGSVPLAGSCSSDVESTSQDTTTTTTPTTTTTTSPTTTTTPTSTTTPTPSTTTPSTTTTTGSTTSTTPTTTSSSTSVTTKYDYAEVIRLSILFYEAQRSGDLPSNNRIPYRGDSALDDEGFFGEDLTGGWFDAGDHVKFNFPMAASTTLLSWGFDQWKDAYQAAGQLDWMYDSIKWPLDYFLKCWDENMDIYYCQVANGDTDHSYWGRPEEMTYTRDAFAVSDVNPGSDVAGETAAALAAGSIAFADEDSAYSAELLSKARTLYTFAKTYQGKYSDSIPEAYFYTSYNGFQDELCLAAAMLYKATGESQYLTDAQSYVSLNTAWSLSWDEKTVACQLILYQETGQNKYKTPVENFIKAFMGNGPSAVPQTNCGLAYRLQWGTNRYAANAAFIALMAADTSGFSQADQYKTWGMSQIHYMLGDNNYQMSYLIGFGNSYPGKPHHRSSSCPNLPASCDWTQFNSASDNPQILYGALVGGPNQSDFYEDERSNFETNEVACDYNAGFQSAAAGLLHFALEGTLPAAPTPQCP